MRFSRCIKFTSDFDFKKMFKFKNHFWFTCANKILKMEIATQFSLKAFYEQKFGAL